MKPRPDLRDERSPRGLDVFQLTDEPGVPWSHVYMEAQVFTPDCRRLVIHRSAHPHGSDRRDPNHRYVLCDTETGELAPLTDEVGATSPSVSPDGRWMYYFVDETRVNAGRLTLKRVSLDGRARETILALDGPARGADTRISHVYPLSTISSDGRRLAISGFFGDGRSEDADSGLLVFDLERATADLVVRGPTWINMHPQYSRSLDPTESRDILLQENHGCRVAPDGKHVVGVSGDGCDIHVVRDDGSAFRSLPFGRNGDEHCQGHQCWRGRSAAVIATTGYPSRKLAGTNGHEERIWEGAIAPFAGHTGLGTPGARRNELSRDVARPRFFHFATDIAGARFVVDANPHPERGCDLYVARLGQALADPLLDVRYLLDTRTTFWKAGHAHPFLSPDGRLAFFNSTESGALQPYMVRLPD